MKISLSAQQQKHIITAVISQYGQETSPLNYTNEFEFLIAVILSAQTQDKTVNKVTPKLFQHYPRAKDLAKSDLNILYKILYPLGFYRQKSKNIQKTAQIIHQKYQDQIPHAMDQLTALPGVGRKTANVILGHFYGKDAIIVDTHFRRVVQRLGFTNKVNPIEIEKILKTLIPIEQQFQFSMAINFHGRQVCHAKKPECSSCFLKEYCSFYKQKTKLNPQ